MKILDKRWKMFLYGCAGIGINLLNLVVGSYLCSALLVGSFKPEDAVKDIANLPLHPGAEKYYKEIGVIK
nr:hypothetical protein [Schwartzia sp. (in: firmicutes)]